MAPPRCLDSYASSNRRDHPLGVSPPPPSHALAKSSFEAAQLRGKPVVRIIRVFSPKLVKTDPANFRALVQKLTGKSSGSSDSDADPITEPLTKIKREEKRSNITGTKIYAPAPRKIISSISGEGRLNPIQTQHNGFATKLFREGDMNSSETPSLESCISWESSESVNHLTFRGVNIELPLIPPLPNFGNQENSLLEDQYWRLQMPTTEFPHEFQNILMKNV